VQPAFLEPGSGRVGFGAFNLGRTLQVPGVIHHEFIDFAPGSIERMTQAVDTAASNGQVALITWEPHFYQRPALSEGMIGEIAAGEWDDYLTEAAEALRDTDQTVLLRFAHEMDQARSPLHPWIRQRPALFIRAWRHVHRIFDSAGADNITWAWTPVGRFRGEEFFSDRWYPGDRWTDLVGFTVYSFWRWEERHRARDVRTPSELVIPRYRAIVRHDKPVIFAEFGIEHHPTRQADEIPWLRRFVRLVQNDMPDLVGVVFFHAPQNVPGLPGDWRLNPGQQRAFRDMLTRASRFELRVP
jgi:beta-mannanase